MKYSQLFGKTIKETPKDAVLSSHKLLYQAGYIRESTAGRYYLLPLGERVHQKIQAIIKQEMDKAGAQQLFSPVLHPKYLWQETNRTSSVGFELMSIKDRNEMEFVLGGTAEEMIVDLVRKFQLSYKDLPFNLYQFSTKFRDEMRARGGLLRLREFVMKDAYSFHATEQDFRKEYDKMARTYETIFNRLGLQTQMVDSDNGYIGGEYCHEFVLESQVGESKYLTDDYGYSAHEDVAVFEPDTKNIDDPEKPLEKVEAVRGTTMEDGVNLHNMHLWQQLKDVLFVDEKGRFILAIIRGDYDVNEVKLLHLIQAYQLRHATEEEIRDKIHSEPGFISPVGIKDDLAADVKLLVVADQSLRTVKNMYGGANKKHRDLFNMNIDRDYTPDLEGDIALAKEGYISKNNRPLKERKGIEVGNIFQLGFHYSSKMKGANFKDTSGKEMPYYMGCYGIGLARSMAAVVEVFHDDKGILWPEAVAPYQVHLVGIMNKELGIKKKADEIYEKLTREGIEVLYDDREDVSAGKKFADADLIGIPYRFVVSAKTNSASSGQDGDQIEVKKRNEHESKLMPLNQATLLLR